MEPNIAVLIDFENIAAGCEKEGLGKVRIDLIMNRLRERGRVLIARSYADWGRFARFKKDLMFENVSLFELSAHGMNDKNRADVALVVDCMELALTKEFVDTYVIVSGDSDFTPLIMKLRELNKRIIGLGTRRSTSRLIIEACDEFIFYDTLHKQKTQRTRRKSDEAADKPLTREEAMELVTEALAAMAREQAGAVHASRIKEAVLRKEPSFNEQDLGFSSLGRFVEYCQKQGIVKLSKDPKGGGYLVAGPDADEAAAPQVLKLVELSDGARRLYELLAGEEMEPLTPEIRNRIAEAVVAEVEFRKAKKKRINLNWVAQDVTKRVRQAETQLTKRHVGDLINVLHNAGVFVHTDGEPVRSFFAAFELRKDAAGLRRALDVALLKKLLELGVDPVNSTAELAELIYADRKKTREVEEVVAWELTDVEPLVQAPAPEEDADEAPRSEAKEEPKRRRSRRKKKDDDDEDEASDSADDAGEGAEQAEEPADEADEPAEPADEPADEEPPVEEKPKKRTTRRKKAAPKTEEKKAEAAPKSDAKAPAMAPAKAEEAPVEEAAKPKRRRAPRKKAEAKAEESAE